MRKQHRSIFKVGVATTDWSRTVRDQRGRPVLGGAGHIRFGQWASHSNLVVVIGELCDVGTATLAVRTYDSQVHTDCRVVILQRHMQRSLPERISTARRHGQVVVNDVDDWFWGLHPRNTATRAVDPGENPDDNIEHYREAIVASSLVSVSTPFLAEQISAWTPAPVVVIRNGIASRAFPVNDPGMVPPTIGWTGSTAHRSDDLKILKTPFAALRAAARFCHIGDHPAHPRFCDEVGLEPALVRTVPMLAPEQYQQAFCFDVGVVPLSVCDFNRAKSSIKGLEYAAAGIPFVASDLPEYRRLHDEFGMGRLAASAAQWKQHLQDLLDPAVRRDEGQALRAAVLQFGVQETARCWDELLWEMAG